MAQFKLFLLTPITTTKDTLDQKLIRLHKTIISEFYSQESTLAENKNFSSNKWTYCYSFDEKLSLHKNGQKEFTFSMLKNLWLDDEWTTNPFVANIHSGTQLLLIDKYENQMFFTVKNIDYEIGKNNITYKISCQDSFTYQTIRQNDGYTIENNPESTDFIGAKSIDWWVINKIQPDCHLAYTYIPLFEGLYVDVNGNLKVFHQNDKLEGVEKIIKPVYDINQYKEYYELIPFSISGGNCSQALINLGEKLGLTINYKEHENKKDSKNYFGRYFWYEPEKNEDNSNLKYSPYTSIQAFSLTQSGDALTTVLNVESNTIEDEIISLIPNIPYFFMRLFESTEWKKSIFQEGYFTSVCKNKTYRVKNANGINVFHSLDIGADSDNYINNDGYLYIKIYNTTDGKKKFLLPSYTKVNFYTKEEQSYLYLEDNRFTPLSSKWAFVEKINDNTYIEYNDTFRPFPEEKLGKAIDAYLRIDIGGIDPVSIQESLFIINFYRDTTTEEEEFAAIADQCPWLENKLIDFSYFYNQNIINKSEYNELMNIIKNELRIVNSRLLIYSNQYYQAIHKKTEILSKLESNLDSLGAAFHADVVSYFTNNGSVKDYSHFQKAYDNVSDNYLKNIKTTPIMNYEELKTEYLNKYFKAQQRFLKNIFNFSNYFYASAAWGESNKVYRHIITLLPPEQNENTSYISFNSYNFASIDSEFTLIDSNLKPLVDIYDKNKSLVTVVDNNNKDEFYISAIKAGELIPSKNYNNQKTYYGMFYTTTEKLPNSFSVSHNENTIDLVLHHKEKSISYYGFAQTNTEALKNNLPENLSYNSITLTQTYEPVGLTEIINEYLYRKGIPKDTESDAGNEEIVYWYYHEYDTQESVAKWLKKEEENGDKITSIPVLLNNLSPLITEEIFGTEVKDKKEKLIKYIENFPITSITYTGAKYQEDPFKWGSYILPCQRVNKENQTIAEYLSYWTRCDLEDLKEVKNPTEYEEDRTIHLVTPSNENNYYRRVQKNPFWGYLAISWNSIGLNIIPKHLWQSSNISWSTQGKNTLSCDGNTLNSWVKGFNPIPTLKGDKEKIVLNYTTEEQAYSKYKDWQEKRKNDFIFSLVEEEKKEGITYPGEPIDNDLYQNNYIISRKNNKILVNKVPDEKKKIDNIRKDYFNYYSLFGFTYLNAVEEAKTSIKLKYTETYLRPIRLTDKINKKFKYKILIQKTSDYSTFTFTDESFNLDTLLYDSTDESDYKRMYRNIFYPVSSNMIDIDFSVLDWTNVNSRTLKECLELDSEEIYNNLVQEENSYWITADNKKFAIFQEENFKRRRVVKPDDFNETGTLINRYNMYKGGIIYDDLNAYPVDFLEKEGLTEGFFEIADKNANYEKATQETSLNNYFYHKVSDNNFERVYTIEEIKNMGGYSYLKSMTHTEENFSEKPEDLQCLVYLHKETYDENKNLLTSSVVQYPNKFLFPYNNEESLITIQYDNEEYTSRYKIDTSDIYDLSTMSNGLFWYNFHLKSDIPILQRHAALIESQLTQYWQQALIASKHCEFFLPENWQPKATGNLNYFSDKIIKLAGNKMVLLNTYLPNVQIYSENGITSLPSYSFNFKLNQNLYSEDTVKNKININNIKNAKILENNKVIQNMLQVLGEDINNIYVEEQNTSNNIGRKTYYYAETGGTKWNELLPQLSSQGKNFEDFNGLYVMAYKILSKSFSNDSLYNYYKAKEEHEQIWNNLYRKFPGIILENVYRNEIATSSQDLYLLAKNAFTDLSYPEKGYSISLIDINNIQGYKGQELKIGDGILIDSEEYYNEMDIIKKALSQYLFITDISYDLRKDNDISLTVNSIKYQNKLIQRLAKLIK